MTMAEQNTVSHLLDGIVRCRNCDAPMAATANVLGQTPRYICSAARQGCDTPEIPAEALARLMVETVIRAALEGDNASRVAEAVREYARQDQDSTAAQIREALWRREMESQDPFGMAPHPSQDMSELDTETRRPVDPDPAEYVEVLRRVNQYWDTRGVTGHIEAYAHDLNTYLRPSNIRATREIIETAVIDISVGSGSAEIRYRRPMPPGSGAEGRTQEAVDLPT